MDTQINAFVVSGGWGDDKNRFQRPTVVEGFWKKRVKGRKQGCLGTSYYNCSICLSIVSLARVCCIGNVLAILSDYCGTVELG